MTPPKEFAKKSTLYIKPQKKVFNPAPLAKPLNFFSAVLRAGFKLFFLFFSVFLIVYLLFKSPLFAIQHVYIHGKLNFTSAKDVQSLVLSQLLHKNIFLTNVSYLNNDILSKYLALKSVQVTKKFPVSIKVVLEERTPVAIISYEENKFVVDTNGYVLGFYSVAMGDLPNIKYDKNLSVGEKLNEDLLNNYLTLFSASKKYNLQLINISFSERYFKFGLKNFNNCEVLISTTENIENSVKILDAFIKDLEFKNKNPKLIDLRYDKVIVSY